MSDTRRTAADAAPPGERHGRDLQKVGERLKELVASLRSEKERLSSDARPVPPPAGPERGEAPADLDKRRLAAELALAREATAHAAAERERLRARLSELEAENQRLCDDFVAVQERSTELAQLYVALERIHGGTTRAETLAALQEIVVNVVGSEEVAILERSGDELVLAQSFGIDPEPLRRVRVGEGTLGRVAATGQPYLAGRDGAAAPGDEDLSAVVPLLVGRDVVGVVAIYRLLGHKPRICESDEALFDLFSAHAGAALHLRARASTA